MARKRMLDPSFWDDDSIGMLCNEARLLFLCCVSQADDDGRMTGVAGTWKKIAFGFTSVSIEQVDQWLNEIAASVRSFIRYESGNHPYIALLNWQKYQKVDHPTLSIIPPPTRDSGTTRGVVPEHSRQLDRLGNELGNESEGREGNASTPTIPAPTPPIAIAYSNIMLGGRKLNRRELSTAQKAFAVLQAHPDYHRLEDQEYATQCCTDWWNEREARGKLASELPFLFFCQDLLDVLNKPIEPPRKLTAYDTKW